MHNIPLPGSMFSLLPLPLDGRQSVASLDELDALRLSGRCPAGLEVYVRELDTYYQYMSSGIFQLRPVGTGGSTPEGAHAASHAAGGTDPVSPASIGAAATSHTHTGYEATGTAASVVQTHAASADHDSRYAPSSHGHTAAQVSGLGTAAVASADDFASSVHTHGAAAVTVDATAFNGNLTSTDDTVQKVAAKVDALVLGGEGAALSDATPAAPAAVPTPGTATLASRADHVHIKDSTKADLVGGTVPVGQLPALLALGETSSTAYPGDKGKTAYDHSQATGNPHGTDLADIGAAAVAHTHAEYVPVATNPASGVSVDATAFNGNLTTTDDTVQKVAAKVDALTLGAGGASLSDALPVINGTAAGGTATTASRADHVHPTDTTRAAADHTHTAAVVSVDATAFSGNLATTDTPVQAVADKLDALELGTSTPLSDSTPAAPAVTPAAGTATSASRADHSHIKDSTKADLVDGVVPTAQLPALLSLGETELTAYRGDRGKDAYDHSQATGNPHSTSLADLGAAAADHTHAATAVSVDATAFSGNLATTDNTVQKVADKVDALVLGGGGDLVMTDTAFPTTLAGPILRDVKTSVDYSNPLDGVYLDTGAALLRLSGQTIQGAPGRNAYVYVAYASDASGSDFATTPDSTSAYLAVLATYTEITTPQASDFAGKWAKFKADVLVPVNITLTAGNWTSNTYTVTCTVPNTAAVEASMPCPTTAENQAAAENAVLLVTAVTSTSITITAAVTPTVDITIAVKGVTV